MQEQNTSSFFALYISMFLTLGFLGIIFLGFQLGNINSFKQDVNHTIERQGGLTTDAIAELKKLSSERYSGYFTIVASTMDLNEDGIIGEGEGLVGSLNGKTWQPAGQQGTFGQLVKYKMYIKIPIPFGGIFAESEQSRIKYFEADMVGSSVSKVRR